MPSTESRPAGKTPGLALAERVMHWVAVLACVFFACAALWECFGAPRSGHFGASAAYAIGGENMVHWRKFAVVTNYLPGVGKPSEYYCHHPYGIVVLEALAYAVFGHHWFTPRAGAILCAIMSAPLVYGFGRRAWGIIPAATATLFFVFVPIDLAYTDMSNLEEPTIAFGLLFAWGTASLWQTWRTRYLFVAALGALGTCNGDWAGFVFVGPVVVFAFVRAYVLPRRLYGRIDEQLHAKWFAWVTAMAVGTLVLYLLLFGKADKLGDLMGSYDTRSAGHESAIVDHLSKRRILWLGQTLTPITLLALVVGLPVALVRLLRKPLEIFPLAWVLCASFQYFIFKQGADIHIFWPHYYAPAAAFATGSAMAAALEARADLAALVGGATSPAVRRWGGTVLGVAIALAFGVPLALLARIGVPELAQSRKTAGRFENDGRYMGTDADIAEFTAWAYANVAAAGSTVQPLEPFEFNYASEYAGARPVSRIHSVTPAGLSDPQRIVLVNTPNQPKETLATIAQKFGVVAVGPYWRVDRGQKGPSLVARRYDEREPNLWQWMFVSGTDLVRTISKDVDPWATWEWRDALNVPSPSPEDSPRTFEELRVAHNIAVKDGDMARATELRARLEASMGRPVGIDYAGGEHLVGVDVRDGPAVVVTFFWETDDTFKASDVTFAVKCKIVARPRLWPTSTDYFERTMAPVPPIRPVLWKPGYIYTQRFVALRRMGKDECRGSFTPEVRATHGDANQVLFTLR